MTTRPEENAFIVRSSITLAPEPGLGPAEEYATITLIREKL
jgi:hypothetical protein